MVYESREESREHHGHNMRQQRSPGPARLYSAAQRDFESSKKVKLEVHVRTSIQQYLHILFATLHTPLHTATQSTPTASPLLSVHLEERPLYAWIARVRNLRFTKSR